jgi:hypothetical protein
MSVRGVRACLFHALRDCPRVSHRPTRGDMGTEIATAKGWTALDIRTTARARRAVLSDYGWKLDLMSGTHSRTGPLYRQTESTSPKAAWVL